MNKKKIVLVIVVLGLLFTLIAQKKENQLIGEWYKKADLLYKLDEPTIATDSIALSFFLKVVEAGSAYDKSLVIKALIKAGNIHQGYQRFSAANHLYHKAISLNNKYVRNPKDTYEAYLYLGSSLYFNNIIDSAQYYFEEASDIAMNYTGAESLPEKDRLYNSLGAIYFESANYIQAKNYFQKAFDFSDKSSDNYEELYTGIQSNIANCLMKLNHHDSALRIFKSLTPDAQQRDIIRQNTAHSYFELNQYDSALAIYHSLPLQNEFSSVVVFTDMGRIYMSRKQWQLAEAVFDSAINRNKSISKSIKNKEEAMAYLYRSQLAQVQGLNDEAITWINEALQEVHLNFSWKNIDDLPEDVSQTVSPITLFSILHTKASLLYSKYQRTKQEQLLFSSLSSYRKAVETANFIKLNFDNDEAKLFFNDNYRTIFNEAIQVAFEAVSMSKGYANDYLFILENYKGNILYQNLQNVLLKSTANIPDSIRNKEKELKQLLSFYTSKLNQTAIEKDAVQLQQRFLSLQVELSRLQKKYEKDASYNLYKYQKTDKADLAQIQDKLDHNTALFNYYTSGTAVYCLVVTKRNFVVKKIETDSLFHRLFMSFTNEVYGYTEGKRYEGLDASAELYRYLIKPIESTAGPVENWVIIPDGFLCYLPFEALVKDKEKRDYLMLDKTISYHYSFALLLEKNTHHLAPGNNIKSSIAFAPFTEQDKDIRFTQLSSLPLSNEEVKGVADYLHTGREATKAFFLQRSPQHSIIHLATHASIGSDSSTNWIHFYPSDSTDINNKLFVHEIYNLDMHQTELVILSACETAGGVTATGEGILSLSRAFVYAGADGIVSTLWKTEDRVTAFLMQRMHKYLSERKSPEKSLQLAKKDLINDRDLGSQYKTPNYWANFVYVGKLHTEIEHTPSRIWWLVGILLMVGCFIFYRRIRRTLS